MPRIRIVTDSTAHFPGPTFENLESVVIAPMTIRCGAQSLVENENNDISSALPLFKDPARLPIADPPSEESLAKIYADLRRESDQILSIHSSSHINAVSQNAHNASQRFLGRSDIQVIDSQTFTAGLGLLVQAAADTAARGADFDTVIRTVRGMIPRLYLVFAVDELTYLEHNGLITRSQAILGTMLGIITFLTMEDGSIIPMEKVRTRARGIEKVIEFVSEFTSIEHLAIMSNGGSTSDDCRILHDRLRNLYPSTPITINPYGPSVATYVGPFSLGVVVLETEEEL